MEIKYLTNDTINKQKWDACITNAGNSLLYAYSFYLDTMAKNWDAIILNDYEAVMPLTWNKKYGIRYLYQPPFTQQLGVFSKQPIAENILQSFLEIIKSKFQFAEIFINTDNISPKVRAHTNCTLSLNVPYQNIWSAYTNDLLKNLKHAEKFSLAYSISEDYNEAVDVYIKEYAARMPHVKERDYTSFKELCSILFKKNMLIIRKVLSASNELLAIALLLKDEKRLYNVLSTVTPAGRKAAANHFLFDRLIKEFAGKINVLDFEGSDIAGIASFYENFGAINEQYYFLRYNNLPWPLHYLKG
jgi:Acetyltransferase (GNAT) domain